MKKIFSLVSVLVLAILLNPAYASEKIRDGESIEGHVILELVVTAEGKVGDVKIMKSVPAGLFDEAALEAARELRFKPPLEKGKPVESVISKTLGFKMSAAEFEASKAGARGIRHLRNGEFENALLCFNDAIRMAPGKGQYNNLKGQVYFELKAYEKALEEYGRAIEKEPGMADAYFDRGEAFRKLGKYGESIEDFTKVVELDADYLQAYNSRAISYNRLKDNRNMCADLKKACELGDCRGINAARKAGGCN